MGWITTTGAVQVSSYDHDAGRFQVATVRDSLEADDHLAPAILVRRGRTARPFLPQQRGAVFFAAVMATYEVTGDEKCIPAARDWAERNEWRPGPRARHADDLCAGQV